MLSTLMFWFTLCLLTSGVPADDEIIDIPGLDKPPKGKMPGAPAGDEITNMPGLDTPPRWKQYSGYLDATGTKKLHYWFVESANNPSKDPLLLWMNGGPGCSAELGLFTQNGPFRIADNGSVTYNPYSWNKVSNMIYLDTPAGVGYSYSQDKNYTTDDDESALDNYVALKNFFTKFPEFRKNEFYITGLSYGGIFVPLLSSRVLDDKDMNFKGFSIGNGLYDNDTNTDSKIYYGYYHGLYGHSIWNNLTQYCCGGDITDCSFVRNLQKTGCNEPFQAAMKIITKSDYPQYNIYSHCEGGEGVINERQHFAKYRQTIPCVKFAPVVKYLNSKNVKKQIHVPDIVQPWETCSNEIYTTYKHQYSSVKKQFMKVLKAQKRILIYNGDFDVVCPFLGGEWFVDSLGQSLITERKAWYFVPEGAANKHVAGFVKVYKDITFTTVMGAGHQVPTDQPKVALLMMTNFLQNKPLQ